LNSPTRPFIAWPGQNLPHSPSELQVDGVGLSQLRKRLPLPLFVTSLNAVRQRAEMYVVELKRHFRKSKVFYAMKANAAAAILREVNLAGCGVDIVSIGEFRAACAAGISPAEICFAGVGKSRAEILEAFESGLGVINVEHADELTFVLQTLADRRGQESLGASYRGPLVALRLNPCVESETHPHLKTGALDSKFGMLASQIDEWLHVTKHTFTHDNHFDEVRFREFIAPLKGIHVHIGSQLQSHDVFPLVLQRVKQVVLKFLATGIGIDHLDLGGGLGVGPAGVPADASDIAQHIAFQADALRQMCREEPELLSLWGSEQEHLHVCIEPGRSMVASSTVFLTEVLYEKANLEAYRFAYVDAGMNAFPRPSIYGAEHSTACANRASQDLIPYTVFGPVCESGDVLARDAKLPQLSVGDVVVFFEAGAYCRSMASHYNLRSIPAEVFCRNGSVDSVVEALDPTAHLKAGAPVQSFNQVVEARRSVRRFSPTIVVPEQVVQQALDHALLAPNSSNLQMWEFVWVRTEKSKKALVKACLSQPAAATAAELIVCVARRDTWQENRQRMLDLLQQGGKASRGAIQYYKKLIPIALRQGPLGFFGLLKSISVALVGFVRPVPREPTSGADLRVWAVKSTALACENLMLSLKSQGFDSCPMEGFDSVRVKKILGLSRFNSEIVMVLGVGAGLPEGIFGPRVRFDRRFYVKEI
jgi:diaminopimelate decarboxylase